LVGSQSVVSVLVSRLLLFVVHHSTAFKMSDFWVRKMKTYFQRIDFDKDGAITQKDFEGMADRFVSSEKLDEKRGAELKAKLLQVTYNICCLLSIISIVANWSA
jgi:hypothetical protein